MFKIRFIATVILILVTIGVSAQDSGLIYGKVTTRTGAVYQGNLRWGGEEVFWTDEFNASKLDTKVFGHMINSDKDESISIWSLSSIWDDYRSNSVHEFSCQFGNIRKLEYIDDRKVMLTLKNGHQIKVGGSGYNDIRASVTILDAELGKIKISGSNVRSVEFMETPRKLNVKFGDALYGTVHTYEGDSVQGFLQYDKDERLTTDFLDGDSGSETLKIPMGKITSIEPSRNGSKVRLVSGRQLYLTGTNDVDDGNRGVVVTIEDLGRVWIPWSDISVINFEKNSSSGPSYNSFKAPKGISGEVILLNNKSYKGRMAYDRDEVWEFEFLDGDSKNWEVKVPFANIKSITPKNTRYSVIELKAGKKLMLGNKRDVSADNGGILLFTDQNKDPVAIDWDEIDTIIFD